MRLTKYSILSAAMLTLAACQDDTMMTANLADSAMEESAIPAEITAIINSDDAQLSKTTLSMANNTLSATWKMYDYVSMSPDGNKANASLYRVVSVSGNKGMLSMYKQGASVSASEYKYYYPGDKIKDDNEFVAFPYSGQEQDAKNPTAHLNNYFSMRKVESQMAKTINFAESDRSSCMKFNLKGMTFKSPEKISITLQRAGWTMSVWDVTNRVEGMLPDLASGFSGTISNSRLSLDLANYGDVNQLEAYMMMANSNVELLAGDTIVVNVTCADNTFKTAIPVPHNTTLKGGYMHNIVANGGWIPYSQKFVPQSGNQPNPMYDANSVVTLHKGLETLNIVLMGDGFLKEDIESGYYDEIMQEAYKNLFSVEPYKSFKNMFNVSYIKAASSQKINATPLVNGAISHDTKTLFEMKFTEDETRTYGNNNTVLDYASKAFKYNLYNNMKNALVIVVGNIECHAGTCWQFPNKNGNDYDGGAIAYCTLGNSIEDRIHNIVHEAGGHGFGRLGDEYENSGDELKWAMFNALKESHATGTNRNIDVMIDKSLTAGSGLPITTKSNVLWADMFGTANNYEKTEGLDIYKGANYQSYGFCRSTESSVMRDMTHNYNSVSRRQIFYRIRALSGQAKGDFHNKAELQAFLDWDKANISQAPALSKSAAKDISGLLPLGAPVQATENLIETKFNN